ncbi:type I polyketide synthase [Paludisphaera borealis]|uniref:Phenolphthiocerol synthesis polyketide synthase type I Pks15/1 n=1 Tax=Paludisphaera borealis TaxID=1387353 RepID=A0A1U7CJ59_9BACT|nr:type I polyketide synthase [Paludisphaera borealis]APW58971.1 Phenolphthiocerol synthesis polyketide synthase type I Pks15/1 [Paludisphaera borealis]
MLWNQRRVFALAPRIAGGASFVIAAGRGGALGVLDVTGDDDASKAIDSLTRFADSEYAVRLRADQIAEPWVDAAGPGLAVVVCTGPWDGDMLTEVCARIHDSGRRIVGEIVSATEAEAAVSAGVDGLIVVGNEAGGRVGLDSAFILLQAVLARTDLPVWVRGGVGPRVAAGCVAAGAAGVVLDGAALLVRESPLTASFRDVLRHWDGGETQLIEAADGAIRVYAPPTSPVLSRLRDAARRGGDVWTRAVACDVGWKAGQAWPIGQDAAFATELAATHVTLGGVVQTIEKAIDAGLQGAFKARPMAESAALAKSHGCRFPILQGPMTRVSDVPLFAAAVAEEGALPFVALALLRKAEVERLLNESARRLEGRSWGVGLLGFVPSELRREQLAVVLAVKPPFALIAGGRPDQAAELEREGIATYLHVPSPGLLDQFLRAGSRRFVLEGRECGGHVGPRSSFVLWEQGCRVIEKAIDAGAAAESFSLVFAGGIHDARSAAAVAALAGDLAARGVRIGVLMGTAYLFTREAVSTGAIVARYQHEAAECRETVLLETGPGHLVRVGKTPFVDRFSAERAGLIAQRKSHDEIRESLETLNLGRLRIAAKGVERKNGSEASLAPVAESVQAANGLYMLGQAAALRDRVVTMRELHEDVALGATAWIERLASGVVEATERQPDPAAVAIVGMSAVLPGAPDLATFWANSLNGRDAITEVPPDRWDWRLYYDADPKAPDKIYSKWGGFVPDVPFDPLRYGMPPSSLPSIEPAQLLALEVARAALADAGYADRPFPRERTAVVLGMGGGAAQVAMGYAFKSYLPMLDGVVPGSGAAALESCDGLLPEWTEDSFPGFLLNVTAGRIANRLNLGGANYTVDAACGSSLAALNLAVRELRSRAADVVVLGGVDTVQNPFTYLAFSKTQAFSPRGRCRPFDATADGIVISEGATAVILKRLADAERDGDRIYAVIQGVGSSSDGRSRGLTAPGIEGQTRALERAYAEAAVDPATVGYVEAHGTGTAVGDVVEIAALSRLMREAGAERGSCTVGSVKSQIGHTKCAAGLAGLIHATLALHNRVLPPTIGVTTPNLQLDLHDGPLRLNTEARPWLHASLERPRRAGVSAFGFGGTNFHVVMEAYERDPIPTTRAADREWPAELLVWSAADRESLLGDLDQLADRLNAGARPALRDVAHTLASRKPIDGNGPTLAIVATGLDDLATKLETARSAIRKGDAAFDDPRGVRYAERPRHAGGNVAFVFPGQGSQAVGMLGDLAVAFEEVLGAFDEFDAAVRDLGGEPIGPKIFPPPAFNDDARRAQTDALRATEIAQPALGAASLGLSRLLASLGLAADVVAGHSYGELVALHEAGALDVRGLVELSLTRGRLLRDAAGRNPGAMAALAADAKTVRSLIGDLKDVAAVNFNGPLQTVVAGSEASVQAVVDRAQGRNVRGRRLPVACAFHTERMDAAREPLTRLAADRLIAAPGRPVFSNLDARPHPTDLKAIAGRLGDHVVEPVRFSDMIAAMHEQGTRVFIEVGPGSVLSGLVDSILGDRPHVAVSCDGGGPGRSSLVSLLHALARLAAAGLSLKLERLTRGRSDARLDLATLPAGDGSPPLSPSTWMVNGSRARPLNAPEPRRLGQANIQPKPSTTTPKPVVSLPRVEANMNQTTSPPPAVNGKPHKQAAAATPAPSTPTPSGASERVMAAFQETMRTFLEVQQATMLAYLTGKSAAPTTTAPRTTPAPPAPVFTPPPVVESRPSVAPSASEPAPPVAPVAIAPSPAATSEPANRDVIAAKLLEIVRDRTGYPLEVLQLGLDIEADLGIDSIKRVEILGKLRDVFPRLASASDPESMDALTRAATLGAIVDRVEKLLGRTDAPDVAAPPTPAPPVAPAPTQEGMKSAETEPHDGIRRLLLEAVDAPMAEDESGLPLGSTVMIVEDDRGTSAALAEQVRAKGCRVAFLGGRDSEIDWSSPASVEAAYRHARQGDVIAGLVHAQPLRSGRSLELDPTGWTDRMTSEARGLFVLAKAAAGDLERASRRGGACLISATAMGGAFASAARTSADFFPGHGAVAGLMKTLAREWPRVRARVVDFDPNLATASIAGRLLAELWFDDKWSEVGYLGDRRVRLKAVSKSLPAVPNDFHLSPGEPIWITGGARGITALAAAELARRWRPTLLLIGTSPLTGDVDDPRLDAIAHPAHLKTALHEKLRRAGQESGPAKIEQAYQALRKAREARANIAELQALGSRVEYAQIDVRDTAGLERLATDWRRRFGDPVGLIHGAGLIQDKLARDKSIESFDRVFSPKVDGALNLVRLVRPELIRFAIFFSSIAGRFGNKGQTDYAAANDVLNKLAVWLDGRWPGRVLAANWGPWSGVGMVSDLEAVLDARGLGMIAPKAGVAALFDELTRGRKGDVEVVLASHLGGLDGPMKRNAPRAEALR